MVNLKAIIAYLSSIVALTSGLECKEMELPITHLMLHCPTREEPEKTDCCYNQGDGVPYCCLQKPEDRLVMTVALSVIISCVVLTVLVLVCCFCPKCLLYDSCRPKYSRSEIIAYTKEEEMALNSTMPYEDQNEKSSYSTQAIKIKPIADV